jgi:beta-glucosidase-like glycosyl hydrolase
VPLTSPAIYSSWETRPAYSEHLLDAVRNGTVPESRLDVSCHRILYTMFRLRVFDNPVTRGPIDVAAGNKIARETQEKAITLLKNSAKPFRSPAEPRRSR